MSTQETVAAAINGLVLTDYADALDVAPDVMAAYESDPPDWLVRVVQLSHEECINPHDGKVMHHNICSAVPDPVRRAARVL